VPAVVRLRTMWARREKSRAGFHFLGRCAACRLCNRAFRAGTAALVLPYGAAIEPPALSRY